MRAALLDNSNKKRAATSLTTSVPAPVGGWNTRDSVAAMPQNDATRLDNFYPRLGQVVLRGGYSQFSTGMTGSVKTIVQYAPATGAVATKLYAVTDAGVYDVTAGGAVGAVAKAVTNGYLNTTILTNSAGTSYLWCCNGVDTPFYYDGAAWTNATITGIATPSKLVYPITFKHRIFAIESNTMNVWYLPLDSIQGLAAVLPYGNFMKLGGRLQSLAAWTLDAGDGPDDLIAAVSSEGQLAVYKGTDPSSASAWALVGVWFVGKPLGRRSFTQLAGDVLLMTENGMFALSKLLQSGQVNFTQALSAKIQPTWTTTSKEIGITSSGWEATLYPQYDALIVNVPATTTVLNAHQYVMNTLTGAWCSFSGWESLCFSVYLGQLYFGMAGGIMVKAWDVENAILADNGTDITATSYGAYNYFGARTKLKKVELFRNLITYNGSIQVSWAISADYQQGVFSSMVPRAASISGSLWDTVLWDTHYWASTGALSKYWRNASHIPGYALALYLQIATKNSTLSWAGTDYILHGGDAM